MRDGRASSFAAAVPAAEPGAPAVPALAHVPATHHTAFRARARALYGLIGNFPDLRADRSMRSARSVNAAERPWHDHTIFERTWAAPCAAGAD